MASGVDRRSKGAVNFRRTAGSGSLRNTASALVATEVARRYRFHSAVIPLPYGSRRPGRGHAFWSFKRALQAGPLGGLSTCADVTVMGARESRLHLRRHQLPDCSVAGASYVISVAAINLIAGQSNHFKASISSLATPRPSA